MDWPSNIGICGSKTRNKIINTEGAMSLSKIKRVEKPIKQKK